MVCSLQLGDSAASQLKVIFSFGPFIWALFRFDQSVCGRSSVAGATGGKVNLGYSSEVPIGERSMYVLFTMTTSTSNAVTYVHDRTESDDTE